MVLLFDLGNLSEVEPYKLYPVIHRHKHRSIFQSDELSAVGRCRVGDSIRQVIQAANDASLQFLLSKTKKKRLGENLVCPAKRKEVVILS